MKPSSQNYRHKGGASNIIRQIRDATNLNARELADMIGVSPSTVTRIEHGETCPSYDDLVEYAFRAGFKIVDNKIERLRHLRGYRSAKEIGDFVNGELEDGLDAEKLRVILRVMPKLVYDWKDLSRADMDKMMLTKPKVIKREWQALLEGIVQFYCHCELWEDAPAWTYKTTLREPFIPRAAVRSIGLLRYMRLLKRLSSEFMSKNIFFTHDEMQLI